VIAKVQDLWRSYKNQLSIFLTDVKFIINLAHSGCFTHIVVGCIAWKKYVRYILDVYGYHNTTMFSGFRVANCFSTLIADMQNAVCHFQTELGRSKLNDEVTEVLRQHFCFCARTLSPLILRMSRQAWANHRINSFVLYSSIYFLTWTVRKCSVLTIYKKRNVCKISVLDLSLHTFILI
jgi:hypothetical protein